MGRALTGHCSLYRALGIDSRGPGAARPRETRGYGKRGGRSIADEIERASEESFPASDPAFLDPAPRRQPGRRGMRRG